MTENQKLLISISDAAESLSISRRSVEYLIAKNELAVRKIGRRTMVILASLRALAARDVASPSPSAKARAELTAA